MGPSGAHGLPRTLACMVGSSGICRLGCMGSIKGPRQENNNERRWGDITVVMALQQQFQTTKLSELTYSRPDTRETEGTSFQPLTAGVVFWSAFTRCSPNPAFNRVHLLQYKSKCSSTSPPSKSESESPPGKGQPRHLSLECCKLSNASTRRACPDVLDKWKHAERIVTGRFAHIPPCGTLTAGQTRSSNREFVAKFREFQS